MPPFSRIRIPVLIDLVEQQRYTPARALARQVERAEVLAGEIDPAITYPEDWVVFRITGFRPDLEDPRMVPGESLRADLSALVERLSDQARLSRESIEGPTLTLDELSRRWSVSRKSIERYRRRGLVGRRTAGEGGATRLVFTRRAVEAFERENESSLGEASGFTRMGDEDRRRIVERAGRYRARLGWTRNQIIGRLGTRFGRSREAIRRVLEGHEEAAPAEPRLAPDVRRAIFDAERAGATPEELAARFERSRASIHRIVNARRADLLRRLDLTIPGELAEEEAVRRQMASALESEGARRGLAVEVVLDASSWIEEARRSKPASAGEERARALAYHALRDRARRAAESLDRSNPSAVALDRAETDLRWAAMLKRALVHAERALVLRTLEERAGGTLHELASSELVRLHRVAYETMIAAVDRYLPVRGGRLAAPVSLALGRRLGHELGGGGVMAGRATPIHGAGGAALHDWTRDVAAWQGWLDPPRGLGAGLGGLDEGSRLVVAARFGLGGEAPRTFEEIESELGVSRGRSVGLVRRVVRASVRARADA